MTETTALAVIEDLNAIDLFNPEIIQPKLAAIRVQVIAEAALLDISTPGNRSALASLAYKVGQSKTFVDKQRLLLVSDQKKALKKIDAQGSANWDFLETLQKEVRKPLTDWEDTEKQRVAKHEENIALTEETGRYTLANWASISAEAIRDRMREVETDGDRPAGYDWQEFSTKAAGVKDFALKQMGEALAKREAYEAEQAELAKLRAESAAREQKEREDRIAREATEKAQQEAKEREELLERQATERMANAKREAAESEARAVKAEADAKIAAERAEAEKLAAVEAERQRAVAHQRDEDAKRDREAAVIAESKAAEAAAHTAREKDKTHRAEVNSNALAAIVALGLSDGDAKKVVTAIAQGKIPCVKVVY